MWPDRGAHGRAGRARRRRAVGGRAHGLRGARCWACKGSRAGGGAAERWHITSADISEHSFPLLGTILAPPAAAFTHAVSFHGFRPGGPGEGGIPPGTEIWIGGRASGKNAVG